LFRATSAHRILAFRAFPSRPAAAPLGARCSHAVSASSGFARASSSSAFAPAVGSPRWLFALPEASAWFACVTPTVNLGISSIPGPPKRSGMERAAETAEGGWHGRAQRRFWVRNRPPGAFSGRLEPTTTERCSDRESVLGRPPLSGHSSRCSHDLSPLRGVPIQPLGLRPPLMCLLGRGSRRPKTRWLVVSRHFRVSIRLDLGTTPKTGSDLRGVCNLFRSPKALQQPPASRRLPSRSCTRKRAPLQRAVGCHSL
jgi:hypothetical protein